MIILIVVLTFHLQMMQNALIVGLLTVGNTMSKVIVVIPGHYEVGEEVRKKYGTSLLDTLHKRSKVTSITQPIPRFATGGLVPKEDKDGM